MRSILSSFPTEKLILHKQNGKQYKVTGLVSDNVIGSEDMSINIEEGDVFERTLPSGGKEYFQVIDRGFVKGMHGIPDNYQSKVKHITVTEAEEKIKSMQDKPHKIFISHSSKDKEYVKFFAALLEDIGLPEGSIICTSVPGYGIPGGQKIYDWLRDQFLKCELRVVYALSQNYYDSPASLNEMGAAWVTKSTDTILLLPGFSFSDIDGCVDKTKLGISLGGDKDELKFRLGELKDTLIAEFGLRPISDIKWERHRDEFIKKIDEAAEKSPKDEPDSQDAEYKVQSTMAMSNPDRIPLEVSFLAVYAAKQDGTIIYVRSLSGDSISAGGYDFTPTQSPREVAIWKEALDTLVEWRWASPQGRKGEVFQLTGTGFKWADDLKEGMHIDTEKDPLEEIKEFDG